jgi:hypothetical protein
MATSKNRLVAKPSFKELTFRNSIENHKNLAKPKAGHIRNIRLKSGADLTIWGATSSARRDFRPTSASFTLVMFRQAT